MSSLWPQLRKRENQRDAFYLLFWSFVIRCHGESQVGRAIPSMLDDRTSSRGRTSHLSSLLVTAGVISLGSCSPAILHSLLCQVDARLVIQPLFMSLGSSLWHPTSPSPSILPTTLPSSHRELLEFSNRFTMIYSSNPGSSEKPFCCLSGLQ